MSDLLPGPVDINSPEAALWSEKMKLQSENEWLRAEIERLRGLFRSLYWHTVENTVNKSVYLDIIKKALNSTNAEG